VGVDGASATGIDSEMSSDDPRMTLRPEVSGSERGGTGGELRLGRPRMRRSGVEGTEEPISGNARLAVTTGEGVVEVVVAAGRAMPTGWLSCR